MTPTSINKKQFICWFIVFTVGMALWASLGDSLWAIGIGIVTFGNLILSAPRERSRPLPPGEVLWMFGGLIALVVLMFASKRWFPQDFGAPVVSAIRHPAVVAVLWALIASMIYRRYKIQRPMHTNSADICLSEPGPRE